MQQAKFTKILPTEFYLRPTLEVARDLLGCLMVRRQGRQIRVGRIVETEAYLGIKDRAAHSFGGRRTERVRSMYLQGGHAYIYFIYGLHYCFNVVTQREGIAQAVLIRAVEFENPRSTPQPREGAGPAKLCAAFGLNRELDGHLLTESPLWLEKSPDKLHDSDIIVGPRIGVDYAGEAATWPLRFGIVSSPALSRPFPSSLRPKSRKTKAGRIADSVSARPLR